jgi:hypothetical protein
MEPEPLTHKQVSSRGGKARAAKLSPERRKEIATNAVRAREAKRAAKRKVDNVSK